MNERMKQLLGQAYDEAVPETWTTLSSEQLGRIYDKFAELIVRQMLDITDAHTEVFQTREMTLDQILNSVKGIPYVNNVVDDWDAKDYSWGVTKKVIEYAQYLQKNPQSVANLPPLVVIDGKLDDGAHRLSAINLLQKRMDPKNPLWKQVKLKVNFGTSADVAPKQGVAESLGRATPKMPKPRDPGQACDSGDD